MNITVILMIAFATAALLGFIVLVVGIYVFRRNYLKNQGITRRQ